MNQIRSHGWSQSFVETNYFASLPENVCAFNLSSISIVYTFFHSFYCILLRQMLSLETSNLKEAVLGKISELDSSALLYCGTSVSASFESCSFSFSPAISISASTCECLRSLLRNEREMKIHLVGTSVAV